MPTIKRQIALTPILAWLLALPAAAQNGPPAEPPADWKATAIDYSTVP